VNPAVVETYFRNRGYGFLKTENYGTRFFHVSNFHGEPRVGQRVSFDLGDPTRLGQPMQAVNITPIAPATEESAVKAGA
jgi:cold shock CspA family protein